MTVLSTCYYRLLETDGWTEGKSGDGSLGKSYHAEREAYLATLYAAGGAKFFKFEQNAFPCYECVEYFLLLTRKGNSFEFRCSENHGLYARDSCYLPRGDPRASDPALAGTLKIVNGEIEGLYGSMVVYDWSAEIKATSVKTANPSKKGGKG